MWAILPFDAKAVCKPSEAYGLFQSQGLNKHVDLRVFFSQVGSDSRLQWRLQKTKLLSFHAVFKTFIIFCPITYVVSFLSEFMTNGVFKSVEHESYCLRKMWPILHLNLRHSYLCANACLTTHTKKSRNILFCDIAGYLTLLYKEYMNKIWRCRSW